MIKFLITVDGQRYEGNFAHSCDAVVDAFDRFPAARSISVKVVK